MRRLSGRQLGDLQTSNTDSAIEFGLFPKPLERLQSFSLGPQQLRETALFLDNGRVLRAFSQVPIEIVSLALQSPQKGYEEARQPRVVP